MSLMLKAFTAKLQLPIKVLLDAIVKAISIIDDEHGLCSCISWFFLSICKQVSWNEQLFVCLAQLLNYNQKTTEFVIHELFVHLHAGKQAENTSDNTSGECVAYIHISRADTVIFVFNINSPFSLSMIPALLAQFS